MANQFKRNYDDGTVTMPDGKVVNVLSLPAVSINYFAVYGFIRACQDPTGGEKNETKRFKAQLEIASALIAGKHEKKSRTFGSDLEDQLDDLKSKLATYIAAPDDMKRFMATLGINRTGYEADIKRVEAKIAKRDSKKAEVVKGLAKIDAAIETEPEGEENDILSDEALDAEYLDILKDETLDGTE